MTTTTLGYTQIKSVSTALAVVAASIGNMLEWYDFYGLCLLRSVYRPKLLFRTNAPGIDLLKAFLAFGVGFAVRPLGAIVIGAYGDRAGRKAALTLTIMVMALGTLVIAIRADFRDDRCRGAAHSADGTHPAGAFRPAVKSAVAAAFLVEHAPLDKKGIFGSWLQASMGMSNILGALVAVFGYQSAQRRRAPGLGMAHSVHHRITDRAGPVCSCAALCGKTPHFQAELDRRRKDASVTAPPLATVFSRSLAIAADRDGIFRYSGRSRSMC